jgi:hypothetical protein
LWMVGPVTMFLSQLIILGYVHIASSKPRTSSTNQSSNLPAKRPTYLWGGSSATTNFKKDRQGSLVAFEHPATTNPGFFVNTYLKKTLSHIREEPATQTPSTHSQFFLPEATSRAGDAKHTDPVESPKNSTPRSQGEGSLLAAIGEAGNVGALEPFFAEKSDETGSADSGLVVMIDDMLPPPKKSG